MSLLLKLNTLYAALKALAAKFPDARLDVAALRPDLIRTLTTEHAESDRMPGYWNKFHVPPIES